MTSNDIVGYLFLALLLGAMGFTWYNGHFRLRDKGYGRFLVAVFLILLLIGAFVLVGVTGNDMIIFLCGPLLWMGLVASLTRVFPKRARTLKDGRPARSGKRTAGRRRTTMVSAWAWMVVFLGSTVLLFFTWQLFEPTIVPRDEGWPAWLVTVVATFSLSGHFFRIARRSREAPEVLQATTAFVLYLRAFDTETRPFVFGPQSKLGQYTSQWLADVRPQGGDPTLRLTLEDYLEEAITEKLGPFVGLGNPYDRQAPDGATREYARDDQWQERFFELADRATCIVVSIGGSANLEWELKQLKERGLGQKLCLFTSPIVPGTDSKILNKLRRTATKRATAIAADWSQASEVLLRSGFALVSNPGPGTVVTFDAEGNSSLLTAEATTPAEFIAPVADWFKHGQKSGRCALVACGTCRTQTYVSATAEIEGAECLLCLQKAERNGKSLTERHPSILVVWGMAALFIAAVSAHMLRTDSLWVLVPLWLVISTLPAMVKAGLAKLKSPP